MPHPHATTPTSAGIVLAGGRASRLGPIAAGPGGKAAVTLGDRTLLDRVLAAVAPHVGRIVVAVRDDPAALPPPRVLAPTGPRPHATVEIVRDTIPDGGPLAALADALRHLAGPPPGRPDPPGAGPEIEAVVLSCDLPLVRPAVVALLLERLRSSGARWVVPQVRGHPQVLLSALRGNLRGAIERHLAAGRRDLRGLVETLAAADPAAVCRLDAAAFAAVDPELESFRDIDTPEDLAALTAPRASAAASPARSPPAPGTPGGTG